MSVVLGNIDPNHLVLYHYTPSDAAAYAFMAIFGVGTIVHFFYLFKLRQAFFVPLIIGSIMETGGYYGRAWGHRGPSNFGAFVLQMLLLLIAPIFLAATVYMSLARIVTTIEAERRHSLIRPRWLAKIFVTFDVLCFLVQIVGAGMQCTTSALTAKLGEKVTIVGLILQILVTVYFLIAGGLFHRRINRTSTIISGHLNKQLIRNLRTIYAASVFILVRNIFRVAEFAEGFNGAVSKSEAYIYVFDATLMALIVWVFIVVHPGRLLRAARKMNSQEQPETTESKSLMSEGVIAGSADSEQTKTVSVGQAQI